MLTPLRQRENRRGKEKDVVSLQVPSLHGDASFAKSSNGLLCGSFMLKSQVARNRTYSLDFVVFTNPNLVVFNQEAN